MSPATDRARPVDGLMLGVEQAVDVGSRILRQGRSHVGALVAKGDRDFATAVDFQIEEAVKSALREIAPEIPFLGEESGGQAIDGNAIWVLDPIDGTVNFARGSPLCGLSLALVEARRPRLAVVDFPFLGERYLAAEGAGAFLNGRPIHCATVNSLAEAVIGLSDFSVGRDSPTENPAHLALLATLSRRALRVRLHGSEALDLAWTAAGRLGATIMLSNLPWDVSGGVLLVREAGGSVFDLDGTPHSPTARCTVASTPGLQHELLGLFRAVPEAGAYFDGGVAVGSQDEQASRVA
jgi:myo-inositol-1(or 4)-monophosphatase